MGGLGLVRLVLLSFLLVGDSIRGELPVLETDWHLAEPALDEVDRQEGQIGQFWFTRVPGNGAQIPMRCFQSGNKVADWGDVVLELVRLLEPLSWERQMDEPREDMGILVNGFMNLVISFCPSCLRPERLKWVSLCTACSILLCILSSDFTVMGVGRTRLTDIGILVYRVFSSIAIGDLRIILPFNVILALGYVFNQLEHEWKIDQSWISIEASVFTGILMATQFSSQCLHDYVSSMIAIRTLTVEKTAMTSLLNIVCDAVVELDADLKIVEESPRFAALLALDSTNSTRSKTLQDFMPEEEKEKFRAQMMALQTVDADSQAGALHSTLRDGRGIALRTELFYVVSQSLDLGMRYLVGVREFGDQSDVELMRLPPPASSKLTIPKVQHLQFPEAPLGHKEKSQSKGPSCIGRGTTGNAQRQSLPRESAASSSGSPSSDGSRASQKTQKNLMRPDRGGTQTWAVELSVLKTIDKWNLHRHGACCHFHCAVSAAQASLHRLRREQCTLGDWPRGDAQCKHCGTFASLQGSMKPEQEALRSCKVCDKARSVQAFQITNKSEVTKTSCRSTTSL
eukprot:CAMPEP_0203971684 /NCGR_PEP_ID=MMETSP0359-20131031/98603_1 /ASSEMBLY_ACC=CAM_ASM_000338 /TAXON_ID=268821 /ORGANISM="Scrippsiella Hangoei, Strain SHTV-5" /LENGTH=569 /DNA_ID=CAMNT_0050909669 /DNA_START=192 /DNA_END=1902 /DNA_ORIENTATION=+